MAEEQNKVRHPKPFEQYQNTIKPLHFNQASATDVLNMLKSKPTDENRPTSARQASSLLLLQSPTGKPGNGNGKGNGNGN